jgi:hypothetical protein
MDTVSSRRKFIQKYFISNPIILLAGLLLTGCGEEKPGKQEVSEPTDPCKDLSNVKETDLKVRQKLGYVDESPISERTCNKCNFWLPASGERKCGGCMLFKGPVAPSGYCTYWAAQQEK